MTATLLKRQRFEDSKSEGTEPRVSKRQRVVYIMMKAWTSMRVRRKKMEDMFPFLLLLLLFSKKSLTAYQIWAKEQGTSTTLYIYWKSAYHIISNFLFEFPGRRYSKAKKNHTSHLQEGLKTHSAFTPFTVSSITKPRYVIRERLESHPPFKHVQSLGTEPCPNQRQDSGSLPTASRSFTNTSDISDVLPVSTKASTTSGDFI